MALFPQKTPTLQVDAFAVMGNAATTAGLPNSNNFDLLTYMADIVGNLVLATQPGGGVLGYPTGVGLGSSVTQATSKVTAFTLNTATGRIITATGALAGSATSSSATWTCSAINSSSVVLFNQNSGTVGAYTFQCISSAGQAQFVMANNTSQSITEVVAVSYVVLQGATN